MIRQILTSEFELASAGVIKTCAALLDVSAAPAGLRKQGRLPSKSDTIQAANQR